MEFYVNFSLNENFEETIKSRFRDDFSYESFSEGEKMRIDLALLFTWRAVAKMKNSDWVAEKCKESELMAEKCKRKKHIHMSLLVAEIAALF